MKWVENHIEVEIPKKPKKITATRFATILNKNVWSTPFQAWCEITKTYSPPFEENKFTLAGKIIETRQIEYLRNEYFLDLKTPSDIYGKDYFLKTYGDFYKDEPVMGGMWDAIEFEGDKPLTIIECKTSSRPEDWVGECPEYYALQNALYGYLPKYATDNCLLIASFLDDKTYEEVQHILDTYSKEEIEKKISNGSIQELVSFKVSSDNTILRPFKISEAFPNMDDLVNQARIFWDNHVLTGISPDFDEKKDAEVLKELRKNNLNPTTDIDKLLTEADALTVEIKIAESKIADKQDRLKTILDQIKTHMSTKFRDGDTKVSLSSYIYEYTLSKTNTTSIDRKALEKDNLLSKYLINSETLKLTKKEKEKK